MTGRQKFTYELLDKPDIQSKVLDWGIEVTASTPMNRREAESYGARKLGTVISQEEKSKFNGQFYLHDDGSVLAYSVDKSVFSTDRCVDEILHSIHSKAIKWRSGYKDFANKSIYIFARTSLVDQDHLKLIRKKIGEPFFDSYYINAGNIIYYWEKSSDIKEVYVSDKLLAEWKYKALQYERDSKEGTSGK